MRLFHSHECTRLTSIHKTLHGIFNVMQSSVAFPVLESNLLAMGFEKSTEGTVATLPRKVDKQPYVENVCQSIKDVNAHQRPSVKVETERTVSIKFTEPEVVTVSKKKVAALPVAGSVSTSGISSHKSGSGGLYGLIKEQAQLLRGSSSNVCQAQATGLGVLSASAPDLTNHIQRTPTVYFCEAKNVIISDSSAEDSSCR
jgi:hypothetical protein